MSVCPNCGASLAFVPAPRFCPQCSQSTAQSSPPIATTLRETTGRYARTLLALIAVPGRLTREYLAGRQLRYVAPLRLYLNASLLFFLVVKVLGISNSVHVEFAALDAQGHAIRATTNPAEFAEMRAEMQHCIDRAGACTWLRTEGSRLGLRLMARSDQHAQVSQHFAEMAPYAVFVLLPVFALMLMAAYRRRHRPYREHLVFSLHMHSFWFLALLLAALLPGALALLVGPAMAVYVLLTLHRVYGGRWWATLARGAVMGALYLAALMFTAGVLGFVAILAT